MNTSKTSSRGGHPSPLPRRAVPEPDEDLFSLLRRTASTMGYPDVRWLLRPQGNKWNIKEKDIPVLSALEDYDVLEHLLPLSQEEVYQHTLHRFASRLEGLHSHQKPAERVTSSTNLEWLSSEVQKTYFLPLRFMRVCFLCLQEPDCYDRLYWRLQLVFHCPHHRVRLLEQCPVCKTPIAAHRQSPFACSHCLQDYRTMKPMASLPTDHPLYLGELLFLKALGFVLPVSTCSSTPLASSPLSTLSDISYLSLLEAITARLGTLFSHQELILLLSMLGAYSPEDFSLLHDIFLQKNAVVFLFFHWLLLDWPTHLSSFLDTWYSLSTPPFTGDQASSSLSERSKR